MLRTFSRDFVFYFLEQLRGFEQVIVTITYDDTQIDTASRAMEPPVPKVDSDNIDYGLVWARTRPLYDIVVCICLSDACHSLLATPGKSGRSSTLTTSSIQKQEFEPRFGPSVQYDGQTQADSYLAFYPAAYGKSVEAEEAEK